MSLAKHIHYHILGKVDIKPLLKLEDLSKVETHIVHQSGGDQTQGKGILVWLQCNITQVLPPEKFVSLDLEWFNDEAWIPKY